MYWSCQLTHKQKFNTQENKDQLRSTLIKVTNMVLAKTFHNKTQTTNKIQVWAKVQNEEHLIGILSEKQRNYPCDLQINTYQQTELFIKGSGIVHLNGYFLPPPSKSNFDIQEEEEIITDDENNNNNNINNPLLQKYQDKEDQFAALSFGSKKKKQQESSSSSSDDDEEEDDNLILESFEQYSSHSIEKIKRLSEEILEENQNQEKSKEEDSESESENQSENQSQDKIQQQSNESDSNDSQNDDSENSDENGNYLNKKRKATHLFNTITQKYIENDIKEIPQDLKTEKVYENTKNNDKRKRKRKNKNKNKLQQQN